MSELINIGLPIADSLVAADGSPAGEPTTKAAAEDFSNLLYGLADTPMDGQAFRLSGRHLLGGAEAAAPDDLLAAKSADAGTGDDAAAAPAAPQRRMSELEFLFHRHAGKPFVMLDTQSTQQGNPLLQPVATAENPRLANVLAMLLPDGDHVQAAVAGSAPPEDLPALPMPWLRPAATAPADAFANRRGTNESQAASKDSRAQSESMQGTLRALERHGSGADPKALAASAAEPVARDSTRMAESMPGLRALADAAPVRSDGGRPQATQKTATSPGLLGLGLTSTSALAQQTLLTQPAPSSAPPAATATTQVAEQLVWMAQTGQNSAQVRLHPEELGMVNIRITLESGSARIAIEATHPDMVQELTSSAPRLRNLLAHEGLGLNALEIEQRTNPQSSGQSGGHQAGQHAGQQSDERSRLAGGGPDDRAARQTDTEMMDDPLAAGAMLASQSAVRLLDLFA